MTKFNRITGNQCPPLPRKSREIKFAHSNQPVTPTVNTKTWCIAHRPDKCEHGEEYSLVRSGEYKMFAHTTCPLSSIRSINVGDEVYMPVRTCIGARTLLKRPTYKGYFRKGVVTRGPMKTIGKPGWYSMQIEWSSIAIPKSACSYKNAPCKTLTIQ